MAGRLRFSGRIYPRKFQRKMTEIIGNHKETEISGLPNNGFLWDEYGGRCLIGLPPWR
jgi:hypothetical protein